MTNEEKRQELAKFCNKRYTCSGCVLGDDACRCGQGYHFTMLKGEDGYMTNVEIDNAFAVAYPDTETTDACFNEDGYSPVIKDSGERRQFYDADGNPMAVRDIQKGKGRCDLMPLDVVGGLLSGSPNAPDCVLDHIDIFVNSGLVERLYIALETFSEAEYGKTTTMLLETAIHFEEGAKKYGEHNWQKGIPVKCYIDSAIRHYLKWSRGDKDEPHDRAFCWNILCAIWTCKHKPELNDYRKEDSNAED